MTKISIGRGRLMILTNRRRIVCRDGDMEMRGGVWYRIYGYVIYATVGMQIIE